MLVTKCPRCGKPTPARLASPSEIVCAACGYDGPPSTDAGQALLAAREYLLGRNARDRQLTDARARALSQNASLLYGVLFVLACVPFVWSFASTAQWSAAVCGGPERFGGAILASLPLVGLCVYGVRSLARIKRIQDELRAACAAVPPARPGDPACCYVCGAPLPASNGVARCAFCQADNYADPAVISTLAERETYDVEEHVAAITRVEAFASSVTFDEQKKALVRAFAVFFLAGYPAFVVVNVVSQIHLSPSHSARYVFVGSKDGDCLARAQDKAGVELRDLVGKKLRLRGKSTVVVTRVYATFLGSFASVADDEGDTEDKVDPFDLCLASTGEGSSLGSAR